MDKSKPNITGGLSMLTYDLCSYWFNFFGSRIMITSSQQITFGVDELLNALEPLIRRVVREELTEIVVKNNTFYIEPNSPLDMEEIIQRKAQKSIQLFSHEEVWGE
ncbi:hypothetical protein PN36_31295 [Candidatus Thiomargarita nelsonii]|uniref:Uncharacterized protein n=1 Tax=Candidatus Thiomargarita nelsonii TaxID=1003181 RepID=A0A4E0QL28_9GAMM|nr:hypothetical protein PN36_31295 [Candidatus Thiomargarita nelsonii]